MIEIPPALWTAAAGIAAFLAGLRTTQLNNKLTVAKTAQTDMSALDLALQNLKRLSEWQVEAQEHIQDCVSSKTALVQELQDLRFANNKLSADLDTVLAENVKRSEVWERRRKEYEFNSNRMTKELLDLKDSLGKMGMELASAKEWRLNHCRTEHAKEVVND